MISAHQNKTQYLHIVPHIDLLISISAKDEMFAGLILRVLIHSIPNQ